MLEHSQPLMSGPKRRDILVRFFELISPEPNSGCWLWTGSTQKSGHAQFHLGGHQGKKVMAYRFSYEVNVGPIPDGMMVCHRCDVPQCVNPDHMFLGTQKDNMADAARKGRTRKPGPPIPREVALLRQRRNSRAHYYRNIESERARKRLSMGSK